MTQRNKKKPTITLIADFGGSASKFFYQVEGQWRSLLMEPEVIALTGGEGKASLAPEQVFPENNCWFQINEKIFMVGRLAQQRQGHPGLKQNKFMRAVVKTLGAITVIAAKHDLFLKKGVKDISLDLTVFLPYGETGNFSYFRQAIKKLGDREEGLITPYGKFRVNSEKTISVCRYEGQGVYNSLPAEIKKDRKMALMMIGYRNMSVLIGESGSILSGATTELGMIRMIEEVAQSEGITNIEGLRQAIVEVGNQQTEFRPLEKLLSRESDFQKEERMENLMAQITRSRQSYIDKLISWYQEVGVVDAEALLFVGGTAMYLGKQLETEFQGQFPWLQIHWQSALQIPETFVTAGDPYGRFHDVYGEYLFRSVKVATEKLATVQS